MNKHFSGITIVLAFTGIFLGVFVANAQTPSFTNNLYFGIRGNTDVTNLQEFLTTEGLYSGPVTGNFFNLTLQAVKNFQIKTGVTPTSGYFGPLTRSKANDTLASELQTYQEQVSTVPTTTAPVSITAGPLSLVTLLEARIGNLFQRFFSTQKNSYSSGSSGSSGSAPATTQSTGTTNSASNTTNNASANTTAATPVTAPTTSVLIVTIGVSGGTATPGAFSVTVKDNTAGSNIFSGTGLAASNQFTIIQGHSYSVTETASANPSYYTVGTSSSCNGTIGTQTITCALTNTYSPPSVIFSPLTLAGGTAGNSYTQTITLTTNLSGTFTWSISSGVLPPGLTLKTSSRSSLTATITGTPSGSGTSTFSLTAKNGSTVANQNYTINIANAAATTPTPSPTPTPTPTPSPTPAPTTSASGLQWGIYTGESASSLSSFMQLVGGKQPSLQAYFAGWPDDFPAASFTANIGSTGKTLVVFWESTGYSESQITNGSEDSYITTFANEAKSYGYPVILAPWEEMNGNWDDWDGPVGSNSPAGFIAMWQHVHNLFVAAGASNVKWAWDVNNGSIPNTAANAIPVYWPGAQYVDYVAVDGFNFGASPSDTNNWQTFTQVFPSSLMTQLSSFGKPIYILSTGAVAGSSKAQWISSAFGPQSATFEQNYPQVSGWIWFNQNGSDGNFLVNSDAASLAAFQAALP